MRHQKEAIVIGLIVVALAGGCARNKKPAATPQPAPTVTAPEETAPPARPPQRVEEAAPVPQPRLAEDEVMDERQAEHTFGAETLGSAWKSPFSHARGLGGGDDVAVKGQRLRAQGQAVPGHGVERALVDVDPRDARSAERGKLAAWPAIASDVEHTRGPQPLEDAVDDLVFARGAAGLAHEWSAGDYDPTKRQMATTAQAASS